MEYRNNEVKFNFLNDVHLTLGEDGNYGYFEILDSCVSEGQDPDGKLDPENKFYITKDGILNFECGRHKTKEVGDWWSKSIQSHGTCHLEHDDELNFAMTGNLVLNLTGGIFDTEVYTCKLEDVYLAQTSQSLNNPWRFSYQNSYLIPPNTLLSYFSVPDFNDMVACVNFSRSSKILEPIEPNAFDINMMGNTSGHYSYGTMYYVKTKTGTESMAGTDSNIDISLKGEFGYIHNVTLNPLSQRFNAFENGDIDDFALTNKNDIGRVFEICIQSDEMWAGSDWLLDHVDVFREKRDSRFYTIDVSKYPCLLSPFKVKEWIDDKERHEYRINSSEWEWNIKWQDEQTQYFGEEFTLQLGELEREQKYYHEIKNTFVLSSIDAKLITDDFIKSFLQEANFDIVKDKYDGLKKAVKYMPYLKFVLAHQYGDQSLDKILNSGEKYSVTCKGKEVVKGSRFVPITYAPEFSITKRKFIITCNSVVLYLEVITDIKFVQFIKL